MTALRAEQAELVSALIANLTGFEPETDENFSLCYDYAASNLLYHNCLDPREKTLGKNLDGLKRKWTVHAQTHKARDLETLLGRYNDDPVFKTAHRQFDIRLRLLSLVWHLAENSLDGEWDGITPVDDDDDDGEESSKVDWRKVLAAGEEVWRPGREEELSEWSEMEEDASLNASFAESLVLTSPEKQRSSVYPSLIEASGDAEANKAENAVESLRGQIQPQFWMNEGGSDSEIGRESENPATSRFSYRVDALMRDCGANTSRKKTLSEYQVLRECLWSLRSPPTVKATVFEPVDGRYRVCRDVCLSSVTGAALGSSLAKICLMLDHVRALLDFRNLILGEQERLVSRVPFTYEAYAEGLDQILHAFFDELLRLEDTVAGQEETYTLINLTQDLNRWSDNLSAVHACHQRIVLASVGCDEPWQKAMALLAVLDRQTQSTHRREVFRLILDLYLKALAPYLRIMGLWLSEGRLEDFRDEFSVERQAGCDGGQQFWADGFRLRTDTDFLESHGLETPSLLRHCLPKVLVSGKSGEVLAILKKKKMFHVENSKVLGEEDFFGRFLTSLKSELQSEHITEESETFCDSTKTETDLDHTHLELDPYLNMAFAEVYKSLPKTNSESKKSPDFMLLPNADPLRSLSPTLARCLDPLIDRFYVRSCASLATLVMDTLDLPKHLSNVRKVFLMEAGDLMHEFSCELFVRAGAAEKDPIDTASLTLYLQDCLSRRYRLIADRVALKLPENCDETGVQLLDRLEVTYEVEWPLDMILDVDAMHTYNKIFSFLLRVKRAMWSLGQLRAKELRGRFEGEFLHRLLLLRSWLLHFVGSVHAYFMSRVLHSTELELAAGLAECRDFDEIRGCHSRHLAAIYDRCFLHPSGRVLREAVVKVFNVCHKLTDFLSDLSSSEKEKYDQLEECEEICARSHQFLASTLNSMTQKRNVPHLDGLAAALVHSCPSRANE